MNKKIKILLLALGVVTLAAVGISVATYLSSQGQIAKYAEKEAELEKQNTYLKEKLDSSQKAAGLWQEKSDRITAALDKLGKEHTLLARQYDSLLQQKDTLARENKELDEQLERLGQAYSESQEKAQMTHSDEFMASLLKEKARLEAEAKKLKGKISAQKARLEDAEKQTLPFERLQKEKEALEEKLEDAKNIADILSKDLLAVKKEKVAVEGDLTKIEEQLRGITRERDELSNQLVKMKQALQQRLVELNQTKKILERAVQGAAEAIESQEQLPIQLPPIVVKAEEGAPAISVPTAPAMPRAPTVAAVPAQIERASGVSGRIITVNDKHKFVVIDIGREDGVEKGMGFDVYRQEKKIGRVEVIETRQNISACDVKEMSARKFKLNDTVRR